MIEDTEEPYMFGYGDILSKDMHIFQKMYEEIAEEVGGKERAREKIGISNTVTKGLKKISYHQSQQD